MEPPVEGGSVIDRRSWRNAISYSMPSIPKQMTAKESGAGSVPLAEFMDRLRRRGAERVEMIHRLAKRIWAEKRWTPSDLQSKCMEAWDKVGSSLGTRFKPLVPANSDRPATNIIFGSGGFSTGGHQVAQFKAVEKYASKPPVILQGLVANRSEANGCNAVKVAKEYGVPVIELDFADWYRQTIDKSETNPILASRYWFPPGDKERPPAAEIARRFDIRQEKFHGELGALVAEKFSGHTDIVSARGYSFQLCSSVFRHQTVKPHVNDTHPGDLTYVDPATRAKIYPGWQSGAIQIMMKNGHRTYRGSLIEVEYMDRVAQIDQLDEGALLSIGGGVGAEGPMTAKDIQNAMKLIDDDTFCTLEPTALILAWGISEKAVPVEFQDIRGNTVEVRQHAIVVGDKLRSGANAWGNDLEKDLAELAGFLVD